MQVSPGHHIRLMKCSKFIHDLCRPLTGLFPSFTRGKSLIKQTLVDAPLDSSLGIVAFSLLHFASYRIAIIGFEGVASRLVIVGRHAVNRTDASARHAPVDTFVQLSVRLAPSATRVKRLWMTIGCLAGFRVTMQDQLLLNQVVYVQIFRLYVGHYDLSK